MMRISFIRVFGLLLLPAMLGGCSSIGPGAVTRDRFDYTAAVSDSWKSQMLLNLVKIRYGDAPVFLDIGQIVAGYSFQRSLGATAGTSLYNGGPAPSATIGTFGVAAGGTLNDSPTVTYSPMAGERFARSLMMPIPPSVILSLIQAGDPIEEVFRTSVQSINGVDNRRVGRMYVRRANPEFYAILPNLERLQLSGDIGMQIDTADNVTKLYMIIRPRIAAAEETGLRNMARILGLDPSAREFRIVYGNVAKNENEIAILTRSIYEILTDMASYITVPEEHVADKRVRPTPACDVGPNGMLSPLIRINSSSERPADAFVAVPYSGYWFSIDNKDLTSKQRFSSFMFLFTFVETGSKEAAPILTIPTTR
jgi:hypothetical protein